MRRIESKRQGRYDAMTAFLMTISILFLAGHALDDVPDWALPYVLLAIALGSSVLTYMRRDDIKGFRDLDPDDRKGLNTLLVTLCGSWLGVVVMLIMGRF